MSRMGGRGKVGAMVSAWIVSALVAVVLLPSSAVASACPNEDLRTGASAQLPDCRAYELVTPPDSNGTVFLSITTTIPNDMFPLELSNSDGTSLLFETSGSSLRSVANGGGRIAGDVYEAQRSGSGWSTPRAISPSPAEALEDPFGGVSADHSYAFFHVDPLGEAIGEFGSLFKAGGDGYLVDHSGNTEPIGLGEVGGEVKTEPLAMGRYISPGGEHVIFTTGRLGSGSQWCAITVSPFNRPCFSRQLDPRAAPTGTGAIYDRAADGPTHVVSLLPGDLPLGAGENAKYEGTAKDGSTVAFKVAGTLYARVGNGQLGARTDKVTEEASVFGGISDQGRYVFYISAGNVYRYDTSAQTATEVVGSGDGSLVNVSADGSTVYFVSHQQLAGTPGKPGEPNLYVWRGGSPAYVATLDPSDLEGYAPIDNWTSAVSSSENMGPLREPSRATHDGAVLIFQSQAELTGYDNNGKTEIYRYAVTGSDNLTCVSCNPLATPVSDARLANRHLSASTVLHNLSDDGSRVFFETNESLVTGDTDGMNDIYEWWEDPEGTPGLALISSGHTSNYVDPREGILEQNVMFAVTPDGSNVFFRSEDTLTPEAGGGGTPAIYDARVGGGFAAPVAPVPCKEEGCRPPASASPSLPRPATASLSGGGNLKPRKAHRHCKRQKGQKQRRRGCGKRHRAGASSAPSAAGAGTFAKGGSQNSPEPASGPETTTPVSATTAQASATSPQAASSGTEFGNFEFTSVAGQLSTSAASGHPELSTTVKMRLPTSFYSAKTKDVVVKLPPGYYGNPQLVPPCSTGDFLGETCPFDSQVGLMKFRLLGGNEGKPVLFPLYNLELPHPQKEIARFGTSIVGSLALFIDFSVRTDSDYGVTATVRSAPSQYPLISAETILWGDPAAHSHDGFRMTPQEANNCTGICGGGMRESGLPPIAFMSNPSACGEGTITGEVTSYQLPGQVFTQSAAMGPITDCTGLPFAPSLEARPTTDVAGAPTGLKTSLKIPQSTDPSVPSTAAMREARVTLPEGMTINPSAADGLAACSAEQVHFHDELPAECPDAAKLGTATIVSPPLARPLEGTLYQRTSGGKGNQFRLWLVSDELGLHMKIPGDIKPDPATGQLTAVFSDLPQVPVARIDFDIWGGARAPLKNPDACGTYETTSVLTPWSEDPSVHPSDQYLIDRAPGGGACPGSPTAEPNSPGFEAGTTSAISGTFSPFVLKLQRDDASQNFGSLSVTLPPGLLGKLAGVSACPQAAIAAAAGRSGAEEKAAPSCPPDSLLGTLWAAAGAGPAPYWTQGHIYLAPPYKGAPLSAAIITPAVAGPFDLGTVVVRAALRLDPETGRITVDSDPLPQVVEGVPLNIRTVAVNIDRDQFMLTGSSCEPLSFTGQEKSVFGAAATLSEPFQLGECGRLPFKPKLSLALKGPTKRTSHPALVADLRQKGGEAGIGRAQVKLPRAAFIDNSHIRTICTRVQFAADKCPKHSIYGHAWAETPLLGYRLEGPVYLRSSNHTLPDMVVKLKGPATQPLEFDLVGKIDSVRGALRNTFETVPDAPVSRFHLELLGGERGLIELSSGLCRNRRATVDFTGQNGRVYNRTPEVAAKCGSRRKAKHHRKGKHQGKTKHRS